MTTTNDDLIAEARKLAAELAAGHPDYQGTPRDDLLPWQQQQVTYWALNLQGVLARYAPGLLAEIDGLVAEVERLQAENTALGVRWQQMFDRAERVAAEVERLQAENEELKHRGAGRPLLSAALDEAEAEVERLRAANSVPTDVTRPTPDTGHLLTRDADILAEAHSWLSLNADPDAVEAEGAVTPTAHLIRDLKGYAERLAAALREAMRDKADAARPTPETPNGDDFCQHCGGGPLPICSFCGPQRTTTIDPGSRP